MLRGRGDVQQFRVELPARKITKEVATDARVTIEMPRAFFNVMADEGARVADWREAFHYGQAKATGVPQLLKLIERVVEMHEERTRLRRARSALSRAGAERVSGDGGQRRDHARGGGGDVEVLGQLDLGGARDLVGRADAGEVGERCRRGPARRGP